MGPGPYPDNNDAAHHVVFSPDGIWAAIEGFRSIRVVRSDGSVNRSLARFGPEMAGDAVAAFDPSGGRLYGCRNEVRTWSLPEFQVIDSRTVAAEWSYPVATRQGLYLITYPADTDDIVVSLYSSDGEVNAIGSIDQHWPVDIDRQGRWLAFARDGELFVRRLEAWDLPYRRIAHLDEPVRIVRFAGDRLAAELESGELWIWPVESGADAIGPFPVHERGCFFFDEQGDWLGVYRSQTDFSVEVWNLRTGRRSPTPVWRFPASVSTASSYFNGASFTPGARWVAAGNVTAATFWPLRRGEPQVLAEDIVTGTGLGVRELAFTPDGRSLIATVQVGGFGEEAQIWVWDLVNGGAARTVASVSWINFTQLAVDPMARFVGVSTYDGVELVPLGGGPTRLLQGYTPGTWIGDIAIDAEGRRVAACARFGSGGDNVIRIWDIKTGEETVLGPPEGDFSEMGAVTLGLRFLPNGFLLSSGSGLRIWNLATKNSELVMPGPCTQISVFGDGRYAAVLAVEEDRESTFVQIADLETRNSWVLPSRISNPSWIAADPAGTVVVSAALGNDAAVQVVPIPDGEPRLLVGHERGIRHVAVSPDGRFVATAGNEGTVRLWPMPDLSKPPLHTLPREELIAKLKTLTNLRVVRDPDSATGWKLDVGPFPGWETVPTW
jgi:WD40 repeat protein